MSDDRAKVLLKTAYDILNKCNDGIYVKNAITEIAFYDNAECDGFCLMNDIASYLGLEDI